MDRKQSDHAYHRSRVDAHIGGSIGFLLFMLALTFLVGDKFEPFQEGASFWEPTLLVWRADTNAWIPAYPVVNFETGEAWQRRGAAYSPEEEASRPVPTAAPPGQPARAMRTNEDNPIAAPPKTDATPDAPADDPEPAEGAPGKAGADEVETPAAPAAASSDPTPAPADAEPEQMSTTAARPLGPVITKELYPGVYSLVLVVGSLIAAYFLYRCARRQARLMLAVYAANEPNRPYDRPWSEIRVTFWALFAVLVGVLFLFVL